VLLWGELGPHLTQCGRSRGLPAGEVSSWSVWPFGHNTSMSHRETDRQTDRTDRETGQTRIRQHRPNCFTNGCPETAEQSSAGTSLNNLNRSGLVCENKFWQTRSLLYIFQLHRAHQENNYQWWTLKLRRDLLIFDMKAQSIVLYYPYNKNVWLPALKFIKIHEFYHISKICKNSL